MRAILLAGLCLSPLLATPVLSQVQQNNPKAKPRKAFSRPFSAQCPSCARARRMPTLVQEPRQLKSQRTSPLVTMTPSYLMRSRLKSWQNFLTRQSGASRS